MSVPRTGPAGSPSSTQAQAQAQTQTQASTAASTPATTPRRLVGGTVPEAVGWHSIRASTVLPARREDIELVTADGLTLVGELALPPKRDPVATLIMLHPLPTHGGFMDSHVFRKASYRLPAIADLAVLRFNTRGTASPRGTSQGAFDNAVGERYDVAAAIEFAEFRDLPHLWLVGWSFGTDLALMHGCDPAVDGTILLSPPLRYARERHLRTWARSGKPVHAIVPEFDDYLRPPEARRAFLAIPRAHVTAVEGGKHLWIGEPAVRRVLQEIVDIVRPGFGKLPTLFAGRVSESGVADTERPGPQPELPEAPPDTDED